MRYLTNDRNIVRDAALTVSNIVASNVVYRTDDDAKVGGGQVDIAGDYSGQDDATIDIKIVDETVSGTPKVSAPIFTGVGNGTMSPPVAGSSVPAQSFTVTLEDLGTATVKAYAPFAGVTLQAQASGSAGNAISLTVDNSAITLTPTDFSLQNDLAAVTNDYTGDEWDFGAAVLNPDQTIPDTAPRITFGADPQVYRQYKFYRDGVYHYGFSPQPVRDVARGTVVNAVSGSRSIAITNGVTNESITGVVSIYDALNGIRAASALIEVIGAIVNDKTSGGQGATDLSLYTSSYVVGLGNSGGDQVAHADLIVTPDASAPTETLTLTVIDGTVVGGETWSVRGDVSGRLANAITNVLYADGDYGFTIPLPIVPANVDQGTITVLFVLQGDHDPVPSMYEQPAVLGAAARSNTYEFIYTKRPGAACDCTTGPLEGSPNPDCLGITPDGGSTVSDESRLIRLQRLSADVRGFISDNTAPNPTIDGTDTFDIDWINKSAAPLKANLDSIAGQTPLAVWQASHVYTIDKQVESVNRNGCRFLVTVPGTSNSSEPTWPLTIGSTVTDNGVTWQNVGKTPFGMWDDMRAQWKAETQALASTLKMGAVVLWAATTSITAGSIVRPTTANRSGHLYYAPLTFTTGSSEPTWPKTPRAAVKDGGGYLVELAGYWTLSTTYKAGDEVQPGDGFVWVADANGTSDTTEPNWFTAGATVTDNTVTWRRTGRGALTAPPVTQYLDRFQSMCNEILAAAGIEPDFKSASTNGDGCWQDFADNDFWFVFNGTEPYLPVQVGHYYHSAKLVTDPATGQQVAQSTHEFGFAPRFGCPDAIQEGDKIEIIINTPGTSHGYQEGDSFTVSIIHAIPLPFGGGQTGNDTLKFHVTGTVDGSLPEYNLLLAGAPAARVNSHGYVVGDRYVPAVANGRFYECTAQGTSAGSPPTFTTNRTSFADGGATFIDMGGVAGFSEANLSFAITQGGIPFGLGDKFTFVIEGGHFQLRLNGGSWSSSTVIADTVALSGLSASLTGLTAAFTGGTAPSWKTGDQWSFKAEATNGADGLRQPTDARTAWTGSTAILIDPGETDSADGILIGDHTIPSDATITLLGSDDNFSTTPVDVVIPWHDTHIYLPLTNCNRAKYKVTINRGGDMNWLWLGDGLDPKLPNGVIELGKLTKRVRMPNLTTKRANFGQVDHTLITQTSADAIADGIAHACEFDDTLLGLVISPTEVAIASYAGDNIEFTDALDFQPDDTSKRLVSVTLQFAAAA